MENSDYEWVLPLLLNEDESKDLDKLIDKAQKRELIEHLKAKMLQNEKTIAYISESNMLINEQIKKLCKK